MARRKIQATVRVADGAGGMAPITDLRFEEGEWPIQFDIPADLADQWIAHLNAECSERQWPSHSLGQLDADENSGTIVVKMGAPVSALEVIWERPRGGDLRARARVTGTAAMSLEAATNFLDTVRRRCEAGTMDRLHRRAHLHYEGLPWRGELFLDKDLRLGPPSKHASWQTAPQVIIVDAKVAGIGWQSVNSSFSSLLRELSIFLNVVVGIAATEEKSGWAWTFETEAGKVVNCDLRPLGYWETSSCEGMPQAGDVAPVPLRAVQRPGLERLGISTDDVEQVIPQDAEELWRKFRSLPVEHRNHFLRAGNAYQIACSMWPDQRTTYAAFMVVACEALKPTGRSNDNLNIYDVVEGLLGAAEAEKLRKLRLAPQRVRSQHLHRGELVAGELVPLILQNYFGDPSFHTTLSELSRITRTCLVEWLRLEGNFVPKRR